VLDVGAAIVLKKRQHSSLAFYLSFVACIGARSLSAIPTLFGFFTG
jgi:hypothetical protein